MPVRRARPARCWRKRPLNWNPAMPDLPAARMAALANDFRSVQPRDHLLVSLDLYGGTYRLLERIMSRFGVTASYVDTNDLDALNAPVPVRIRKRY